MTTQAPLCHLCSLSPLVPCCEWQKTPLFLQVKTETVDSGFHRTWAYISPPPHHHHSLPGSLASTSQLLEHADRSYVSSQAAPAFQKILSLHICLIPSHPTAFMCRFPNVDCSTNWLDLQFFLPFPLLKLLSLAPLHFFTSSHNTCHLSAYFTTYFVVVVAALSL